MEDFKYYKDNKDLLIAQKKSAMKKADAVVFYYEPMTREGVAIKEQTDTPIESITQIRVKAVINATNLIDSHMDCHLPNIWKKSLKEKKLLYLLETHEMKFNHVISDKVTASTEMMSFKDLGMDYLGVSEVLIFDVIIDADRNPEMFKAYLKGWVKNHSVGMQYVTLFLCINSEEKYYIEEKGNWDKYYPFVANKEIADQRGVFWAVTEAKLVEGSAVVLGSNKATPTISVEEIAPKSFTQEESHKCTLEDFAELVKESFNKIKN